MNDKRSLARRDFLILAGATASAGLGGLVFPTLPAKAAGSTPVKVAGAGPRHGMSFFGGLKYAPGFVHFDYVNPDAPKGGTLSQVGPTAAYNAGFTTFDTLNGYILKGNAAQRLDLVFDTLMVRAYDEPSAVYGLVAESAELSPDGNTLIFRLRKEAHFHDGTPLTAEDAAFSLMLLKQQGHPLISQNLREMKEATADGPHVLSVTFTGDQTRDLPLFIAGELPIFSKAYYTANIFDETTLEPPLGSGPYRIGDFKPGRFLTYERVADYWARDLNVNVGQWNFDRLRFEYFRDRTAEFEAFKTGAYTLREEFTSRVWATEYNFPAVQDGRVKRLELADGTPSGAQGWFINTRRRKFADPRVRQALGLAFDFKWANKNLFYGLYQRTESYFENSPMKAQGLPSDAERVLLTPWKNDLPPSVFGEPVSPPASDGSGQDRALLRKAAQLLVEAGWTIENGKRVNADGEALTVEFLQDDPMWERICAGVIKNLRILGVDARFRLVDSAQYQDRMKNYDFDLIVQRYSMSLTPGIEIRSYWSSAFADVAGGRNLSGIADPAVDALIEKVIVAATPEEQVSAARALDRVLRAGHYWIPQWYKASHHLAFWDIYDRPAQKPDYERGVLRSWWTDRDKADASGKNE